jgi:hypothetical protein
MDARWVARMPMTVAVAIAMSVVLGKPMAMAIPMAMAVLLGKSMMVATSQTMAVAMKSSLALTLAVAMKSSLALLVLVLEWRETQVSGGDRKLIVHADNARPHPARVTLEFMKQNGTKTAPHPSHLPHLTPSDFPLFGHIKQLLIEHEFPGRETLLEAVGHILEGIEKSSLDWVFLAWIERPNRRIRSNISISDDHMNMIR